MPESKLEVRLSEKIAAARALTAALHRVEMILQHTSPESGGLAIDAGYLCEPLAGMAANEIAVARAEYEAQWTRSCVTSEPLAGQLFFRPARLIALCRAEIQSAVNAALRAGLNLPETFRLLVWPAGDDFAVMRGKLAELTQTAYAVRETLAREIETARAAARQAVPAGESKPKAYKSTGDRRKAILSILKKRRTPIAQSELIAELTDADPSVLPKPCPDRGDTKGRRANRSAVSKAIQELREIDGHNISESPYLLGK